MLWENLKSQEFPAAVEASRGVCVIPIGATEKHGQHLPVGIDTVVVDELARRAAEVEPVVVFPPFAFGHINGLQYLDGSICLSNKLILDYLSELCREIARSGFKKILFLNGHGGNPPILTTLCNSMAEEKHDYAVMWVNCFHICMKQLRNLIRGNRSRFSYLTDEDIATVEGYCDSDAEWGHACFHEVLAMLACRPETVDLDLWDAENGRTTHRMDHLNKLGITSTFSWLANYPNSNSSSSYPGANERLARALMEARVEEIAEIYRAVKEDTELLAFQREWNAKW